MSVTLALKSLFSGTASDEWLMQRYAQTADNKYLERLYDSCCNDLYHFLLTQSDPLLARDICQKSWLKVIEKRHLYQPSGRFIAWLFTLARNELIDEYRRQSKWVESAEAMSVEVKFEAHSDLQYAFDQVLGKLPFLQREAFCLQQEGFGLQEISDICDAPIETVKSRIRYAKVTLRQQLEGYHE